MELNYVINRQKILVLIFVLVCLGFTASSNCYGNNCNLNCDCGITEISCLVSTLGINFTMESLSGCIQLYYSLTLEFGTGSFGTRFNLTLPADINSLTLINPSQNLITLESNTVNDKLTRLAINGAGVIIDQADFFTYFPGLGHLTIQYLHSEFLPHLTHNVNLTEIVFFAATIRNKASRIVNHNFVSGLYNLSKLSYTYGDLTGIVPNSFSGATRLVNLDLGVNKIQTLSDSAFEGLDSLTFLGLQGNDIKLADSNAFAGLTALQALDLGRNPSLPLDTILPLKSLREIYLDYYDGGEFPVEPFQQLPLLTLIQFNYVEFICDCRTEWISRLASFGIDINTLYAVCVEPISAVNEQVNNASLYTPCPARDYQCFNRSIVCEGFNWDKVESGGTCICTCPVGYFYSDAVNNAGCIDINECDDSRDCDGICINTIGSYICRCETGFVNVNASECSDIDECSSGNANCLENCTNTIGSYFCSCFDGFPEGQNGCTGEDECVINNGNCTQVCTDTIGSYFCSCFEGYSTLGANGCTDIDECASDNGNCAQNCTNTIGSYFCSCLEGYTTGVPNGCADIDECGTDNGNCAQNCTNTIGSYICSCRNGYLKNGTTDCVALECTINNGGCAQFCNTTSDSVVCSCNEGYSVSVANLSDCELTMNPLGNANIDNLGQTGLYIVSVFAVVFLVIIFFLFILMVSIFYYYRRQKKKEVVSKVAACKVVYLPKRDNLTNDVVVIQNESIDEQVQMPSLPDNEIQVAQDTLEPAPDN